MAAAWSFVWLILAVGTLGTLGEHGAALPTYSATITREQRAVHRALNAAPAASTSAFGDLREGRLLVLQTLSALAGHKIGKLLQSSSSSSSSSGNKLQNWFTNPFNVTFSVGVANGSNPTPIYNTFPISSADSANYPANGVVNAALVPSAYRGAACNANELPPCTSGITPCNNNNLPACYFAWPACNSNELPPCGAVLGGVACNDNLLPYCVDVGVPCNSNDLNFCINAPSPCNDNNWPYCPGFGAFAASFDGVVNGVVGGGAGVVGPNGPFYSPNINTVGNAALSDAVNSPFFTPISKVGSLVGNGQSGSNGALFVKNNIRSPQTTVFSKSGDQFVPKPNVMSLTEGLYDAIANSNSSHPWTFEVTRAGHRESKPLKVSPDAIQKYMVAIAPISSPTLGVEALTALGNKSPPPRYDHDDYLKGEEGDFEDDFDLLLYVDKNDERKREPRKPQNETRAGKLKLKPPTDLFKMREKHSKKGEGPSSESAPDVLVVGSKHAELQKTHDLKAVGSLKGLPERFHELAKISKVTFDKAAPKKRSNFD